MSLSRYSRLIALGAASLAVMGGAAACGGGSDAEPTPAIQVKTPGASGTSGGGSEAASEKIKVSMKDNLFEPKTITVAAGKTIEVELKNDGQAVHNMHILSAAKDGKDYSSPATVAPGTEAKFTFKLTKPGTYDFQCDYHLPDMVGKITVQ